MTPKRQTHLGLAVLTIFMGLAALFYSGSICAMAVIPICERLVWVGLIAIVAGVIWLTITLLNPAPLR